MAGIGFRLQKYFKSNDLFSAIQGSVYSIIISSGPWLISVLTIAAVSFLAHQNIQTQNILILKSIICYTYAVSLIVFGAMEMPVTRYLADQLYKNDYTTFKSVFLFLVACAIVFGTLMSGIFYSFFPSFSPFLKITASMFFCAVLIIWISMIFLSAAKNYHQIIASFTIGALTSVTLTWLLGKPFGLMGHVVGYCLGQFVIALMLSIQVLKEFKGVDYINFEFLDYFKKFKVLIWVGLFYYLGIWVDKIIFWFGPNSEHVTSLFFSNRYYDSAMFLAYLTIVPSMAIFLVQIETNFYKYYSYYFHSIELKNSLNILDDNISDIVSSIRRTLLNLLKIQLLITLLFWLFAEELLSLLYLPSMVFTIFKYGVLGAFLQSLFLVINIILLYFLKEKRVLFHYFLFFSLNAILSLLTTTMDFKFHGLGYLVSSLIVFLISLRELNKHVNELNFFTFMSQPISQS